jgi:hypothetical protein
MVILLDGRPHRADVTVIEAADMGSGKGSRNRLPDLSIEPFQTGWRRAILPTDITDIVPQPVLSS